MARTTVFLPAVGRFVLRTPSLPFGAFYRDSERIALAFRMQRLLELPLVREALFLASPSLHDAVYEQDWRAAPREVKAAVARYLMRMTARCTPFGLFGTLGVGQVRTGNQASLVVDASSLERSTRVDGSYLFALAESARRDPKTWRRAQLSTNTSLYRCGARYRYVEVQASETKLAHAIADIDVTEATEAVLQYCREPREPADVLAQLSRVHPEIPAKDLMDFVQLLIDEQVLQPDIGISLTGSRADVDLARLFREAGRIDVSSALESTCSILAEMDAKGAGRTPKEYEHVAQALPPLPSRPRSYRACVQVDAWRAAEGSELPHSFVTGELSETLSLLCRLTPQVETPLQAWTRRFRRKFEGQRVALARLLDDEVGVPFGASEQRQPEGFPLLRDVGLRGRSAHTQQLTTRDQVLLRFAQRDKELKLDKSSIAEIERESCGLSPATAGFARIGLGDPTASGGVRVIGASGPTGLNLLSRFCHLHPELGGLLQDVAAAESLLRGGRKTVEIVHSNERGTSNIASRPLLQDFEFEYLGRSGAPRDRVLKLDDLSVFVDGDRVSIWSERLREEVLPTLSTAHNPSAADVPIYRFLAAVARQEAWYASWHWGLAASILHCLPRVSFGRFVVSRASWRITPGWGQRLRDAAKQGGVYRVFDDMRRRYGMPRFVALVEYDNELVLDLDDQELIDLIGAYVAKRTGCWLAEVFPAPQSSLCVDGSGHRFASEVIVPLIPETKTNRTEGRASLPPPSTDGSYGSFPGDDWVYVRIYAGESFLDEVLAATCDVMSEELETATEWHFLRYADPDTHLRFRYKPVDIDAAWGRLGQLTRALKHRPELSSVLHKVEIGTYKPEAHRYGGPSALGLAETVFTLDSRACAQILALLDPREGYNARWQLTVRGVFGFASALGLENDAIEALFESSRERLRQEFASTKESKSLLSARFREFRERLDFLVGDACPEDDPYHQGLAIIDARDRALRRLAGGYSSLESSGHLSRPLSAVVWSFVHMHANRLLDGQQRMHELLIHDFVARTLRSRRLRKKHGARV